MTERERGKMEETMLSTNKVQRLWELANVYEDQELLDIAQAFRDALAREPQPSGAGEGLEALDDLARDIMEIFWPNGTTSAQDRTYDAQREKLEAALRHNTPSAGEPPTPLPHIREALHDALDWVRQTEHEDFIWKKLSEALTDPPASLEGTTLDEREARKLLEREFAIGPLAADATHTMFWNVLTENEKKALAKFVASLSHFTIEPLPPDEGQVAELRRLAHQLYFLGGKLRLNLNDSFVWHPEQFHKEGLEQLLSEWDAAVREYVTNLCTASSSQATAPPCKCLSKGIENCPAHQNETFYGQATAPAEKEGGR